MSRRMLKAAVLGVAIASVSSVAEAQNVLTQGLALGLDASYANVTLDGEGIDESEGGFGFGLRAGYALNRMWQPYLNWGRTSFEVEDVDATLQSIDIGTRVNFPLAGKSWVPFADVAYNIRSAKLEDGSSPDLDLDGSSFTIGGGVQWVMNSQWSLEGGLQYQMGKFDEGEQGGLSGDVDIDANTLRLNFGFTWRPMSR
jgi:opacity protein-like surface antigen